MSLKKLVEEITQPIVEDMGASILSPQQTREKLKLKKHF